MRRKDISETGRSTCKCPEVGVVSRPLPPNEVKSKWAEMTLVKLAHGRPHRALEASERDVVLIYIKVNERDWSRVRVAE